MASYATNEFRPGIKVMVEGDPCVILGHEFVNPGKGQAFTRVKLRNLKTQKIWERTYKSGDRLEAADIAELTMQYLYKDHAAYHFMVTDTFEQYEIPAAIAGDDAQWLKEEDLCQVMLWDGEPLHVTPPNFVELEVTETDPGIKGDTATGGSKPAVLATGAIVKVPLFVQQGEVIRVDTRTGDYMNRVS